MAGNRVPDLHPAELILHFRIHWNWDHSSALFVIFHSNRSELCIEREILVQVCAACQVAGRTRSDIFTFNVGSEGVRKSSFMLNKRTLICRGPSIIALVH